MWTSSGHGGVVGWRVRRAPPSFDRHPDPHSPRFVSATLAVDASSVDSGSIFANQIVKSEEDHVGIELLERAAEAGGRLLRVERLVASGSADSAGRGAGFLLTFDVGRVLVAADRVHESLMIRHVDSAEALSAIRLMPLDEEEPWWRLAGQPLTGAWLRSEGEGAASGAGGESHVRLQFREPDQNPKRIAFLYEQGSVRVIEVQEGVTDGG